MEPPSRFVKPSTASVYAHRRRHPPKQNVDVHHDKAVPRSGCKAKGFREGCQWAVSAPGTLGRSFCLHVYKSTSRMCLALPAVCWSNAGPGWRVGSQSGPASSWSGEKAGGGLRIGEGWLHGGGPGCPQIPKPQQFGERRRRELDRSPPMIWAVVGEPRPSSGTYHSPTNLWRGRWMVCERAGRQQRQWCERPQERGQWCERPMARS